MKLFVSIHIFQGYISIKNIHILYIYKIDWCVYHCRLVFFLNIYMHHWKIFRSSYRKLAWVGFKPTTTEFRSDPLTNWAIRPWVQLILRANLVQLLQFHFFVQCSHFILPIVFFNRYICFKRNLAQVITLAAEWLIHMVFTTEGFLEVAMYINLKTIWRCVG